MRKSRIHTEGQHSQWQNRSLKKLQLKRILGRTLTWFVTDSVASAGLTKNNLTMVSQDVLIELDSSGLFFPCFLALSLPPPLSLLVLHSIQGK